MTPLSAERSLALTTPDYRTGYVRRDRGKSWMRLPDTKRKMPLLYVDDYYTDDTYVFGGFPKRPQLIGTLTGFDRPYGMCVDKKADVYIANYGNGALVEYAYGGTTPLNTYTDNGGYLIGCSVNADGDVAVTALQTASGRGSGNVCIWKGGKGSPTCISASSIATNCNDYLWTFGWDNEGNLIGEGEDDSISPCAILAGETSITELSTSGVKIDFPGGTQWDGKHIALGDQEANDTFATGVWDVTLSGRTLTAAGPEVVFSDTCYSWYVDDANPFFTDGKKNILNDATTQATAMVGPNLRCFNNRNPQVAQWAYPAGGSPRYTLTSDLTEPYGTALDIPTD